MVGTISKQIWLHFLKVWGNENMKKSGEDQYGQFGVMVWNVVIRMSLI